MKQKKNKENKQKTSKGLKATIIIVIIILALEITFSCLYFFTDLFKSNKELFFKYTAQIVQQEDGFIGDGLKQYLDKKQNTPYEDNGNIDFDISLPDLGQNDDILDNFNISFSGKINKPNAKNEQNITLNYSNDTNFPFYYRKSNDMQGIQSEYIGTKYIAIRDGQELQGADNIDLSFVDTVASLQNLQIPYDQIQALKTTYFDNIINQIENSKFSKISEENKVGYRLSLTGDELKNVLTQILETLKNDENTLNQLNELLGLQQSSSKIRTTDIDNLIDDLNDAEIGEIEITAYNNNGKVSGLEIKQEYLELSLERTESEGQETYNATINLLNNTDKNLNLGLVARFNGLNSNNVNESYEISVQGNYQSQGNDQTNENQTSENLNYKYTINNSVQFAEAVDIEDFSNQNAVILNDQDEEYVSGLLNAIQDRLVAVNQKQMEQLGATAEQNPLYFVLPTQILSDVLGIQSSNQLSEVEATEFNEKFYLYEGTSQRGVTVRGLLSTIALNNGYEDSSSEGDESEENENNRNNNPQITEIHFDGEEYEVSEQNITLIKDMVETETLYRVEFELDSNTGLIYRAVINKQ